MAQDKEFINGLNFKPPREQAPEFVKGTGSINKNRLIEFLQSKQDEWVNFNVMVGRSGNWYAEVDNWKPDLTTKVKPQEPAPAVEGDDIPW
jgi:hypothetical protein